MMSNKFYAIGFEDGLNGSVCNDASMTSQEAFAYRKGFAAGMKAADFI